MMTKTKTKTTINTRDGYDQPLYLRITEERSNGYYHLRAQACTQKYDTLNHEHVPSPVDDDYGDGHLYSDLRLTAQGDSDSQRRTDEREPVYGWSLEYHDPYRCDRRKVARMHKTLDALHKRLGKLQEQRGYPRTFPDYCGRLAEVMGCEGIVVQRSQRSQRLHSLTRWDWYGIGDGVNRVASLIYAWRQEAVPAPAAAASDSDRDNGEAVAS